MTALVSELQPLSDREFRVLQQMIHDASGIYLSPAKKALVVGRLLRRLRTLGLRSFAEYAERAKADPAERIRMLDAICTNETHFFREPKQFEFLQARLFPEWEREAAEGRRARSIRVWSAACSSGEEPYSVAMSLLARFPAESGWSLDVLATDLSTKVLARAQDATWPIDKAAEIPLAYRKRFMLRGVAGQEGRMKAGPEVRALVRFARLNLSCSAETPSGSFDLIFCRNVLIYFDLLGKRAVVDRLLGRLAPGGVLLLGHAETLNGMTDRARSVGPTAYARL